MDHILYLLWFCELLCQLLLLNVLHKLLVQLFPVPLPLWHRLPKIPSVVSQRKTYLLYHHYNPLLMYLHQLALSHFYEVFVSLVVHVDQLNSHQIARLQIEQVHLICRPFLLSIFELILFPSYLPELDWKLLLFLQMLLR